MSTRIVPSTPDGIPGDAPPPEQGGGGRSRRANRLRWFVLGVLSILVWFVIGGLGAQRTASLADVQENDAAAFLPSIAESTRVTELSNDFQETSALPVFIAVQDDDGLDQAELESVQEWATSLGSVTVEAEGEEAHAISEYLLGEPTFSIRDPRTGQVGTSEDGQATEVLLLLDEAKADDNLGEASVLGALVETVRGEAESLRAEGLTVAVGGPGGISADFDSAFDGIDGRLLMITLSAVFVILLLVYRSPVLPIVALLAATFALSLAALVIYPLADAGIIQLSGQSQGILFILVIGAATDYALLLVARYREELHRHRRAVDALVVAWKATLEPIVASGGTVAMGLLCLLLSELGSNRGLGPVGAIGIVASMLAVLTFLPAMLLAGRWLFWPRRPKPDHVDEAGRHASPEEEEALHGAWGRTSRWVGAHARPVWIVTALGLLFFAAFLPTFEADGTTLTEGFRNREESVVAQEIMAEHFASVADTPTVVITPEAHWRQISTVIGDEDHVDAVVPVTEGGMLEGGPGAAPAEPSPMVKDGRVMLNVTLDVGQDTHEAERLVERLRSDLDDVSADAIVGGSAAESLDTRHSSQRDLRVVVPTVLAVVLIVLIGLLRSLVAPVLLVVANVVSFAAALGACALIFNHVLDLPGADPSVPLFGFVFLIALGIDYTIFLMTRAREESMLIGTRRGVLVALTVTGGVITSAGIVLAATFSALVSIPLLFMLQLAIIVPLGVLIDTFIVRSLLVPALSVDIGKRLWAPSKLAKEGAE